MDLTVQGGQSPASYMESAADWPPPITRVSRKPKVAQFCAAPWPNFTPPLTTALGATPTAMPGSEVYQALATGVIDGAITDVAAAVSRKYFEVQDAFTVVPVLSAYLHGYLNPAFYDGLSDASKAALAEAGLKASEWAIEASVAAGSAGPDQLREKGVKVHVATPEENAALEAIMRPAFDKAFGEGDADSQKLLELLAKM